MQFNTKIIITGPHLFHIHFHFEFQSLYLCINNIFVNLYYFILFRKCAFFLVYANGGDLKMKGIRREMGKRIGIGKEYSAVHS